MLMIPLHEQPIDTTENIFQRDKVMMMLIIMVMMMIMVMMIIMMMIMKRKL